MGNEEDPLAKPDYLRNVQYSARDLAVPVFSKPQEIRGPGNRVIRSIAYSPNGKKVATGCDIRGLRVWDARDKMDASTAIHLPTAGDKASPHAGNVKALAWSPADDNILASGCAMNSNSPKYTMLVIWDITSPKAPIFTHKLPYDIMHMSFHPNGAHIAVVCQRGTSDEAYFFSREDDNGEDGGAGTGKWSLREDVGIGGQGIDMGMEEINALRFSNSGKLLLGVSNDGSLSAWTYPITRRVFHAPSVTSAPIANGTNAEAGPSTPRTGSAPGKRAPSPSPAQAGAGGNGTVGNGTKGEAGENGNSVAGAAAGGKGGEDVDMDVANGTSTSNGTDTNGTAPSTATLPAPSTSSRSTQAVTAVTSNTEPLKGAALTKARQLTRIKHAIVYSASLLAMGLDPTGRYLAVGGQDALLSLFTTRDWICVRTFDCAVSAIRHITFSPDGELIAFGGDDMCIYIISVHSGQVVDKIPIQTTLWSLSWHPTNNWLGYAVAPKGTAVVWYMVRQE